MKPLTLNSCTTSCNSLCNASTSSLSSATRLMSVAVVHSQPEMRPQALVGDGLSESRSVPFRVFTAPLIFFNSLADGTMVSTGKHWSQEYAQDELVYSRPHLFGALRICVLQLCPNRNQQLRYLLAESHVSFTVLSDSLNNEIIRHRITYCRYPRTLIISQMPVASSAAPLRLSPTAGTMAKIGESTLSASMD
jgi:hypothetical protein